MRSLGKTLLAFALLHSVFQGQICLLLQVFLDFLLLHFLSLELELKLTFSSPVATAEFSKFAGILSAALSQHHLSGFETAPLEFHHLH